MSILKVDKTSLYFSDFFTHWHIRLRFVSNPFWTKIKKSSHCDVVETMGNSLNIFFSPVHVSTPMCALLCTTGKFFVYVNRFDLRTKTWQVNRLELSHVVEWQKKVWPNFFVLLQFFVLLITSTLLILLCQLITS